MGQWASILAPEAQRATICYDSVVVGRQDRYANGEGLDDILGGVWFGARSDVRISVKSVLRGHTPPGVIWVRLVETSQYKKGHTRLFVLRKIEESHYWAVDWRDMPFASDLLNDLPPQCPE
jgi:hypothetical protein